MTTETRTFIGFGDICGIEFECRKCSARISLKTSDNPPLRCSNCNGVFIVKETQEQHAIEDAMFRLRDMAKQTFDNVSIRLEIKRLADG